MSDDKDKRIAELEAKVAALTMENAQLKSAASASPTGDGAAKPAEKKAAPKKSAAKKSATLGAPVRALARRQRLRRRR